MLPSKSAKGRGVLQPAVASTLQQKKAIEDIYQKKSQLEHILLRPDTYIGSTEKKEDRLWVHDGEQLVQKDVSYAPGLYKIFDEILVNAADNKVRDAKMDALKVDISSVSIQDILAGKSCSQPSHHGDLVLQAENCIRIWNNGDGVPVEIHKEEKVYVPEMIFGHLLTSSNYDDNEQKVWQAQACFCGL